MSEFEAGSYWTPNWLWALPLIALTVMTHGFGLVAIRAEVTTAFLFSVPQSSWPDRAGRRS
jgi:hypothetical protein